MYQVFKNGKTSIKTTFATYEQARQAVRRLLRKKYPANKALTYYNSPGLFTWTSNPMIGDFGYSIRKV